MPPRTSSRSSSPISVDFSEDHFWEFATFSAEGRIFRVPKHRFINDSDTFSSYFTLALASGSDHEYTDDDPLLSAVRLDVGRTDFGNFLKVLYPRVAEQTLELSKEEWISVLKLSTKWSFSRFRKMAIETLTPLITDAVEKVKLGKEYNVSSWLESGYRDLVVRDAGITPEEAETIDYASAITIYSIRDAWNKSLFTRDLTLLDEKIQRTFSKDFDRAKGVERLCLTMDETKQLEDTKVANEVLDLPSEVSEKQQTTLSNNSARVPAKASALPLEVAPPSSSGQANVAAIPPPAPNGASKSKKHGKEQRRSTASTSSPEAPVPVAVKERKSGTATSPPKVPKGATLAAAPQEANPGIPLPVNALGLGFGPADTSAGLGFGTKNQAPSGKGPTTTAATTTTRTTPPPLTTSPNLFATLVQQSAAASPFGNMSSSAFGATSAAGGLAFGAKMNTLSSGGAPTLPSSSPSSASAFGPTQTLPFPLTAAKQTQNPPALSVFSFGK